MTRLHVLITHADVENPRKHALSEVLACLGQRGKCRQVQVSASWVDNHFLTHGAIDMNRREPGQNRVSWWLGPRDLQNLGSQLRYAPSSMTMECNRGISNGVLQLRVIRALPSYGVRPSPVSATVPSYKFPHPRVNATAMLATA